MYIELLMSAMLPQKNDIRNSSVNNVYNLEIKQPSGDHLLKDIFKTILTFMSITIRYNTTCVQALNHDYDECCCC